MVAATAAAGLATICESADDGTFVASQVATQLMVAEEAPGLSARATAINGCKIAAPTDVLVADEEVVVVVVEPLDPLALEDPVPVFAPLGFADGDELLPQAAAPNAAAQMSPAVHAREGRAVMGEYLGFRSDCPEQTSLRTGPGAERDLCQKIPEVRGSRGDCDAHKNQHDAPEFGTPPLDRGD